VLGYGRSHAAGRSRGGGTVASRQDEHAVAFQRVALSNCQARDVEERTSDAPEVRGRWLTRTQASAAARGGGGPRQRTARTCGKPVALLTTMSTCACLVVVVVVTLVVGATVVGVIVVVFVTTVVPV